MMREEDAWDFNLDEEAEAVAHRERHNEKRMKCLARCEREHHFSTNSVKAVPEIVDTFVTLNCRHCYWC